MLIIDLVLLRLSEPLTGKYINPVMIDKLWSHFRFSYSEEQITQMLKGKDVKIYGWGQTERGYGSNQLQRQDVNVGWLRYGVVSLSHQIGCGACRGDSGGMYIYRKVKHCSIMCIRNDEIFIII